MKSPLVVARAMTALFAVGCLVSTFAAIWSSGELQSRLVNQGFATFILTVIFGAASAVLEDES